jgi:uridine phosphorylase
MKKNLRLVSAPIPPSELVLNGKGRVYHLDLQPDQVAEKIILVGDPGRVSKISAHFDSLEHKVQHREFLTHTGRIGNQRITVLATGIGVDNVDIVINEVDALVNIDLEKRMPKKDHRKLQFVRLGTSGALQKEMEVGSAIHSQFAIGLDRLLHHYGLEYDEIEDELNKAFMEYTGWKNKGLLPYSVQGSNFMNDAFSHFTRKAITLTANGFYGPQGRAVRLSTTNDLNNRIQDFRFQGLAIGNYEMETSALFGLGGALGHDCTTICLVIANRLRNEFLSDYSREMDKLIVRLLDAFLAD